MLVGFSDVIAGLGDRHAHFSGVERHLDDNASSPIGSTELCCGSAQCFAITEQLLAILVLISDLSQYPLQEQAKVLFEFHLLKHIEDGGTSGCLGKLQIQGLPQRLLRTPGKALQFDCATATTEAGEDRHQQKRPLGLPHSYVPTSFRQGLQNGD